MVPVTVALFCTTMPLNVARFEVLKVVKLLAPLTLRASIAPLGNTGQEGCPARTAQVK